MEMRASEDIGIGQDLTPPFPPLSFSLHDSFLLSHCSACFSPLSPPSNQFPPNPDRVPSPSVLYCSPQCSKADSDLHFSSAEHHLLLLLQSDPAAWPHCGDDTSDFRAALRLLRRFEHLNLIARQNEQLERIGGLMSNRDKLMLCLNEEEEDGDVLLRISEGAKAMAMARRIRDGLVLEQSEECMLEEGVLSVVLTNAVEVQVNGGPAIGIAVFDTSFSWINHSCSPNACYWFSLKEYSCGESRLRIAPAFMDRETREVIEDVDCNKCELGRVAKDYGPRIIVRSIKAISKGEEVSVAYTDLLQPKQIRQSELWLKYRFICSCWRCSAWPSTYVDHSLQEISSISCSCTDLCSDQKSYRDDAAKSLVHCVDDAITEYLTSDNPRTCCEKLENLLTHGLLGDQFGPKEENLKQQFVLHPLHHLALSAYTTLASAYKTCASDLLVLDPEMDELLLQAFNMNRFSAAYSLLLAGATHHLFMSESSLLASVANFWTSAGEMLLNFARSSTWKLFAKWESTIAELSSFPSYRCCKCALVDKLGTKFAFREDQNLAFEDISTEFLDCVKKIIPNLWTFLIHQGCYLKLIKDPVDFGWVGAMNSYRMLDLEVNLGMADAKSGVSNGEAWTNAEKDNKNLFRLGVHCLLYGGFLSSIFIGEHSNLASYMQNLLNG